MVRALRLAVVASLVGCGLFGDGKPSPKRSNRQLTHPGMPMMAPGEIPEGSPRLASELVDAPRIGELPEGTPALVMLVVLDGVRADRLSSCGYERPTSPNLSLLRDRGSAMTCHAYTPSPAGLPALGTLLSGVGVEQTGMLRKGVPLSDGVSTLAEVMAARGYQTLLLSGNPLLKKASGLTEGFHRVKVAPALVSPLRDEGMAQLLRYELAQVDATRPVFLVVDIFDAHEPYPPIPDGLGWVSAQEAVVFGSALDTPDPTYARFAAGDLKGEARRAWLQQVGDAYDHAVLTADASLGRVVKVLERMGLGDHGVRVVVTSDHGVNLGEHDTVRHDGLPWEGVTRVPLLFFDTTAKGKVVLPEPVSTAVTFSLITSGALPDDLAAPRSYAVDLGPRSSLAPFADTVALWPSTTRKLLGGVGQAHAFDLVDDPDELRPLPPTAEEQVALDAAVADLQAARARAVDRSDDDKLLKLLDKVGYASSDEAP
ncbi:MAG: sulfatase-like hydrolase/transferase [Alphaproteobacteria bacterium]|nr:sulfatase-like hydrolase/transferase [Alphaproteobacteria bacterium]